MIIVLIFEGRIKIGKMCIMSTKNNKNQTKKQTWMHKKSLKKARGNQNRRTDKTMTTKKYQRTNNDLKCIHIKLKTK
jgi:hypothetical protein